MNQEPKPSIFARILLIFSGLAVIGLVYWFINTSLMPVAVPPTTASRAKVVFDKKLDVSKNDSFFRLRNMSSAEIIIDQIGRSNPFVPVINVPKVTSTVMAPTSSVSEIIFNSATSQIVQ